MSKKSLRVIILVLSLALLSLLLFGPPISAQDQGSNNELRLDDNLRVSWLEETIGDTDHVCVSLSDSRTVLADWCHDYGQGSILSGSVTGANLSDGDNKFWLVVIMRSTGERFNLAQNIKCLVRLIGDYESIHCSFEL